ncbi:MAG: redoxin domain-containing protein [Flammeovirgaceae bacterium]|nr:redoxin domain-containing protein [Flammeovirgaceae bacterium]
MKGFNLSHAICRNYNIEFWIFCHGQKIESDINQTKNPEDISVLFFFATDCPITQKYMSRVKEIVSEYSSEQISFTAYFPSPLDKKKLKTFRKEYNVSKSLEFIFDKDQHITEKLNAMVTPEVFVVNSNSVVVYSGAIDNWFYELGRYRLETNEHYLKEALSSLRNGEAPVLQRTEAIGCVIQREIEKPSQHHHE